MHSSFNFFICVKMFIKKHWRKTILKSILNTLGISGPRATIHCALKYQAPNKIPPPTLPEKKEPSPFYMRKLGLREPRVTPGLI